MPGQIQTQPYAMGINNGVLRQSVAAKTQTASQDLGGSFAQSGVVTPSGLPLSWGPLIGKYGILNLTNCSLPDTGASGVYIAVTNNLNRFGLVLPGESWTFRLSPTVLIVIFSDNTGTDPLYAATIYGN